MRILGGVYLIELLQQLFAFKATMGFSQVAESIPTNSTQQQTKFDNLDERNMSASANNHRITQTKLKLLKRAIERNPFETWFFKNRFQAKEDLFVFSFGWKDGVVERNSTTSRLKKIFLRSLNAENVNIAIMGGSISAGGGLSLDKEDMRGLYYQVFADWWQKTVTPFTGSTAILHKIAVGGTASNFFAFCYKVLLNPNTDMDLALLDFTVNDYIQFKDSKFPTALPLEQLTREILSENASTTPLFVNFVQGKSKSPVCDNLENHGQTKVAQNYGITAVSLRSFLCWGRSRGKTEKLTKMFTSDGTHASILGHAQVALMIINYVRQTMLTVLDSLVISDETTLTKSLSPSKDQNIVLSDCSLRFTGLPKPVFDMNQKQFLDSPLCFTQITPDGTKNGSLHQTLHVKEVGNFGFQVMQRVFIRQPNQVNQYAIQADLDSHNFRTDAYGGWKAQSANSILELELSIPLTPITLKANHCILKDAQHFIPARKLVLAVRTFGRGGTARAWLDEYEEQGVLIDTRSGFGHTKLHTIARQVTPGRHVLSVRTETPGIFILSGIMISPIYK